MLTFVLHNFCHSPTQPNLGWEWQGIGKLKGEEDKGFKELMFQRTDGCIAGGVGKEKCQEKCQESQESQESQEKC